MATPDAPTIAALAEFLGVGQDRTAKATFFVTGDGRLLTAIVRGDFEVNETKLANVVGAIKGVDTVITGHSTTTMGSGPGVTRIAW